MGNEKIKTTPYPQSKLNYENLKEQPKKMVQSYNFCYIPYKFQSLVMLRNCNQIVINIYDIPTYLWLTPSNQHLNSLKSKLQKECQVHITCFSTFNDLKQYIKQENKKHSIQYNLICSTNQLKNVIKYYGNSEMIKQIICFSKDIEIYWEIKKSSKSMSKFVFGTNQVEELIQFIQMNRHKQYSFKQLPNFISLKSEIWLSNIQILSIYAMLVQQTNRQQMVQHFCKFAHWIAPNYHHDIQEFKKEAMQDQLIPERAIHWYSKQSFVFKVINSTLRSSKSPFQLFYLQSFCKDLIIAIKYFHNMQKKIKKYQSFKCYRGGYVSKLQIDKLKQSIGGIVQNMGFLSTSLNKKVAECFVTNVIFEISVTDKQRDEKIEAGFAHIQDLSFMQDQQQVLFNPLNYFHVQSIVETKVKQVQSKVSKQKIVYEIKMVYGSIPEMMSKRKNNKSSLSQEQKKYLALMDFQLQKLEGATTQGCIFFQDCFIEGCCQYWEKALELSQYENVSYLQRSIIRNVCLEHLAECYSRFDRYAQALNVLEEARKIAFKVFGPKDIECFIKKQFLRTHLNTQLKLFICELQNQSYHADKQYNIFHCCSASVEQTIIGQSFRLSMFCLKVVKKTKPLKLRSFVIGTSKKEKQQFRQQVLSKLFEIYKSKQNYRVCQRILKNKDIKDLKECDIFQKIKQKRKVCNSNQKRKMHIKQLEKQRDQIIEKQGKNHKRYLDVILYLWIQQCIQKQFIKADSNLRQLVENSRLYHGRHNINHAKNIGYVSYLMSLFWYNNISIMQMCKQAEDIVAIYGGQHPQSLGILTNCSKAYLKRKMYKQSMRIEQLLFRNKLKTQVSPNIAETSTN